MTTTRSLSRRSDDPTATRSFTKAGGISTRDSGAEAGAYTIVGHAAVFNEPSDFGHFTEYVAPGAFKSALKVDPLEVVSNWQHDDRWILGHTLNGTLELKEDARGLRMWTRVAPTSYGADARILIDRRDVQQASFCFTIKREVWDYNEDEDGNELVSVTIMEVGTLYDVTICALGAYPQTDIEAQAASRSRLDAAIRSGRVRGLPAARARKLTGTTADRARRKQKAVACESVEAGRRRRDLERAGRQMVAMGLAPVSKSSKGGGRTASPKAKTARTGAHALSAAEMRMRAIDLAHAGH
jgi:uncharacterized protein